MDSLKCLLVLTSCCLIFATPQSFPDLDTANLLSFQGEPKSGHVEVLKDDVVKKVYAQLLGKRMLEINTPSIIVEREPITAGSAPVATGLPEVMLLHRQLQNKLGWGSDDNSGGQNYGPPSQPQQQYGPPPNQPPQQQYGPPPNQPPQQQYGPPPNQPPQPQYGPPPNQPPQQQYGPPPNQPPQQQYGPPPNQPPQQQYGPPPNQPPQPQYGPPPNQPPQQQYGPPPNQPPQASSGWQPSTNYGAPQSEQSPVSQHTPGQEYGSNLRVNQGVFGGHIENSDNHNELKSLYSSVFSKDAPAKQRTPDTNNNVLDNGNSKIYKHVYIHTPPAEKEVPQEPRVIRAKQEQDTHYQIIFVKAPSPPQRPPVTVELPSPPIRKTLLYVLIKKNDLDKQQITFKTPPSTPPPQPEVYFIRYKGGRNRKPSMTLSDIESNAIGGSNDLMDFSNEGYSNGNKKSLADFSTRTKSKEKVKESAGYPDAEYRPIKNMLGANNDEPMSFDVYNRIRAAKQHFGTNLMDAASSIIPQTAAGRRPSHYTAPGSLPFDRPSGRMINGEYIGMSSDLLRSQFFTTPYE